MGEETEKKGLGNGDSPAEESRIFPSFFAASACFFPPDFTLAKDILVLKGSRTYSSSILSTNT